MSLDALLRDAYVGRLTTPRTVQFIAGLRMEDAAALCGVSVHTYRRWGADRSANLAAMRLLAVVAGYVPWEGWEGWTMSGGCLFPPGYSRGGLLPGEILGMIFVHQQLAECRRRLGDGFESGGAPTVRQKAFPGGGV